MTQFVPVWSGRRLHSRRLARVQLWLGAVGVGGMALAFASGSLRSLPLAGGLLFAGIWTFVYNLGRTLPPLRRCDRTERHFAFALGCFGLLTVAGLLLAFGLAVSVRPLPIAWDALVGAHVALAVFGAVLTTVLGALYQLAATFTGVDPDPLDDRLGRVEGLAYPAGVLALAGGRLAASPTLARLGTALLFVGLAAFGVVFARWLVGSRAERSPMVRRYRVAAVALGAWLALTAPAWLRDPLAAGSPFGASERLLVYGVVGFVAVGTLYHVVPFLVWESRYAGRIGFEPVPGVDDLYDGRLAAGDFAALVAGTTLLTVSDLAPVPAEVRVTGTLAVGVAASLVAANLGLVVTHGDVPVRSLLPGLPKG
jgi:hypothetical protein